jgi:hypothetical protein
MRPGATAGQIPANEWSDLDLPLRAWEASEKVLGNDRAPWKIGPLKTAPEKEANDAATVDRYRQQVADQLRHFRIVYQLDLPDLS